MLRLLVACWFTDVLRAVRAAVHRSPAASRSRLPLLSRLCIDGAPWVKRKSLKPGCRLPPGSEIAGEAAAALSAAALMYRKLGVKRNTGAYITHAKQLYNLAAGAQGSYADANPRSCLGIHKVPAQENLLPDF